MPLATGIIEDSTLPPLWRQQVESQLTAGEHPIAHFEPDLDAKLHYSQGLVVLTDRRILSMTLGQSPEFRPHWQFWYLRDVANLRHRESSGMGTLELVGDSALETTWQFTAAKAAAANLFLQAFQRSTTPAEKKSKSSSQPALAVSICPSCGALIEPPSTVCEACTPAASPPPVRSLWRLSRFARPRAVIITLGLTLTLASTAATLVFPYITMLLISNVLTPHELGRPVEFASVTWYLVGLAAAAVLAWMLNWAKTYALSRASEQISADLRNDTYAHLQRLSLEFFGGKRTGDLISRVGSDTDRICSFLSLNLLDFITDVVLIVMTAALLWKTDHRMALYALLPFPLIAWLTQKVRVRLRHGFVRAGAAWAEMVNVLADTIPGIRVVKAFAQERREIDRFAKRNQHVLVANNRVNVLWSFFGPTVTLLTDLGMLVIWGYAAWLIFYGSDFTVAKLFLFTECMARLYLRLESMSKFLAASQRAAASTHRIFEILDRRANVAEPVRPVHPGRLAGKIELRNVAFKYGTRTVIRDVSLAIEPGQMIGLVGPSGAGKSTLVNLICRFYDVAAGSILVDGNDIRSFPIEEYRQNIGIVLQEPFLFYGTIAENVAYGRPDATSAEIIAAARAARAHEFILNLPDGYDSLVGERGQSLSGGERQRISIARAILTDPRILILDEATSSVDTETEREIQEALQNLIEGRTTIAIAHRLSTLRRADKLVVLEQGAITAVGAHDELVETSDTYARLNNANQQTAERIGA
ncbi:MAG TPA: ABC transporter ATP-binding protein [Lacipirellulaceae bacterium]|nr:ABC transporter ATP-binding protein [Lacipirellulaceae bacterium]